MRSSLGLEALDRRLCLQRVGMGRPENFRLRFENLVNMARASSALPCLASAMASSYRVSSVRG